MSMTTNGKNQVLDALDIGFMSLHTAFPGNTGTSEVSGGSYARKACTFGASAAGVRSLSAAVTLDVPTTTVRWVGLWDTASTSFQAYTPNGSNPKEFVATAAADTITAAAHGYADTQTVVFYGATPPAPLVEGAVYYVRDATADTFKVAATSGGVAIDITDAGAGACVVSKITEEVYGVAGTHTISTVAIGLPH